MADDKFSLSDLKDVKDSFDSIKSDLNKDDNTHYGGNDYKNYDHNGNLADDISNGKEKLGNAIDKAKDIGKNIKALDKMDKAAGGKGLKNGAEGLKNLAAGGDKTKAALNALKGNLAKGSSASGGKSGDGNSSGGSNSGGGKGEDGNSKSTAEKMAETAQKTAEEAKLAIKMASKIAAQNYVGAAMDALKNPAAFARLLKKILIIIVAVCCIITLIVLLPIILIACLFFWLLPGATTNSASKENPDVAVKDMSDGEKDVLDGNVEDEDMDKDMKYTIEKQYEQIYNVVYNECEKIFSSKEDEFKKEIISTKSNRDKYNQEKTNVEKQYGSNLTKVYFNNLSGSQNSDYKVYSGVKKDWVKLDNHGFSPNLDGFDETKSSRSFYDHADLDTIADDIAYIMACYTVANGDCAPISEGEGGGEPSETIGYRDEFKEACEKKKVTENLFALTTTEDHYNSSRSMPSLSYYEKTWGAFLTADEIFKVRNNINGYNDKKYPQNVYFLNVKDYNDGSNEVNTDTFTQNHPIPSNTTKGSRGEDNKETLSKYLIKMGADVNLSTDAYKLNIAFVTDGDNHYAAYSLNHISYVSQNLTERYSTYDVETKEFSTWMKNNKTLNDHSIVSEYSLEVNNNASESKNYVTSANKVKSYKQSSRGAYFASPYNLRLVEVKNQGTLNQIGKYKKYTDENGVTTNIKYAFDAGWGSPTIIATYDDDKNRSGGKNVTILFDDLSYDFDKAYGEYFKSHSSIKIVLFEEVKNYNYSMKEKLGLNYRFKVTFSNLQVPIIENKTFTYDCYYVTATVDGFDRDLITQNMFLDAELYKDRMYEENKDMDLENKLFFKDIKKGKDDDETIKNILAAKWYSYDENFVYHCEDNCSGCCMEKEGATASTKSTKDPDEYSEDNYTDGWERIDNSKKDTEPGKGQHSKDTKFCTGTSDTCEYCGADKERWFSLKLFGWTIDLGSVKKVKVRNPEEEKEKCTEVNKYTGMPEEKEVAYTVKKKINWFVDNILESVENVKSLRTVAANSTSDVAIVAKAMQFQGSIGGERVVKFMGSSVYSDYKIWNAAFISYCADKCDISTSIIPKTFSIKDFQKIKSAKVQYEEEFSLDDLKTGDIVYIHDTSVIKYTKKKYPKIEHEQKAEEADGIGLVVSVDKTNEKVNVIEGCAIDKDISFKQFYIEHVKDPRSKSDPPAKLLTGGIVALKQYDFNKITGYTRPAYEEPRGEVQIAVDLIGTNIGSSISIDYASFTSNKLVIGYYKWTGNEAFKLLKRIYNMDKNAFTNALKDNGLEKSTFHTLIATDDDPDKRNNFGSGLSATERSKILKVCQQMLQSPSGLISSESQKLYDMAKYMEKVRDVYHESSIKVLMTDLMFAEKNPLLLETTEWAKNFKDYFYSNFGSGKDAKALDVAKQYFVTDANKNGVPSNIAQRAKDDIAYLSKISDEQFKEELTEEEQKQAEKNAETMENFKNGTVPTFTKPVSPISPKK